MDFDLTLAEDSPLDEAYFRFLDAAVRARAVRVSERSGLVILADDDQGVILDTENWIKEPLRKAIVTTAIPRATLNATTKEITPGEAGRVRLYGTKAGGNNLVPFGPILEVINYWPLPIASVPVGKVVEVCRQFGRLSLANASYC